jgi:hypothetical protein
MKVPGAENAVIEPAKVRHYLLAQGHPVGRFNAVFFRAFGYAADDWQVLEADLRSVAEAGEAVLGKPSEYGQKYEVRGIITGPNQKTVEIVTVWIIRTDETFPRFVTAHPLESR